MKISKTLLLFLSLSCLCACHKNDKNNSSNSTNTSTTIVEKSKYPRFSSTFDVSNNNDVFNYQMIVPYDDQYDITFHSSQVSRYIILDENGQELYNETDDFVATLKKDQVVTIQIHAIGKQNIQTNVTAKNHVAVLPYETSFEFDATTADTVGDPSVNPLKPAVINYVKRAGGTYINSNNPEKLEDYDLNKALIRNTLEGDVFFTFEHNNYATKAFYYGYQVYNNNDHAIYVTVQNIGFQLDGPGSWLGQDEWIQFYNTLFTYDDSSWSESQWETFYSDYNFSKEYTPAKNQPITYILPAGQKMYVMGGTTSDSYRQINVFNTANRKVKGGCSNAAVLFSINGGTAEGAFYVYEDPEYIKNNTTHQGYITHKPGYVDDNGQEIQYGRQYIGYDNCHGVVDNEVTWYFNDVTSPQELPVTYTNYYKDFVEKTGEPYSKIDVLPHIWGGMSNTRINSWLTHLNPHSSNNAVGSDMTAYYTINENGENIVIDYQHYDGHGMLANVGNWMIDYQDDFNFVNQGNKDREVTITLNGDTIAAMMRDENGKVIPGTEKYTLSRIDNSTYSYEYTLTVPAHSVKQVTLEYNLLANSYGAINHKVILN